MGVSRLVGALLSVLALCCRQGACLGFTYASHPRSAQRMPQLFMGASSPVVNSSSPFWSNNPPKPGKISDSLPGGTQSPRLRVHYPPSQLIRANPFERSSTVNSRPSPFLLLQLSPLPGQGARTPSRPVVSIPVFPTSGSYALVGAKREQAFEEAGQILLRKQMMLIAIGDVISELTGQVNFFLCPLVVGVPKYPPTTPRDAEVLACLSVSTCHVLATWVRPLCQRLPTACFVIVRLLRLCPLLRLPPLARSRPRPPLRPANGQRPDPPLVSHSSRILQPFRLEKRSKHSVTTPFSPPRSTSTRRPPVSPPKPVLRFLMRRFVALVRKLRRFRMASTSSPQTTTGTRTKATETLTTSYPSTSTAASNDASTSLTTSTATPTTRDPCEPVPGVSCTFKEGVCGWDLKNWVRKNVTSIGVPRYFNDYVVYFGSDPMPTGATFNMTSSTFAWRDGYELALEVYFGSATSGSLQVIQDMASKGETTRGSLDAAKLARFGWGHYTMSLVKTDSVQVKLVAQPLDNAATDIAVNSILYIHGSCIKS